jgi:hypothetical protein
MMVAHLEVMVVAVEVLAANGITNTDQAVLDL